jgi:MFS transporter, DHA1 family, solute carrier family 18 (vesicular acetylcholine transporter), member 3
LEGLSCFIIPFTTSYKMLMIPICIICFGIALIDTALLPTLGYLVDTRYVSVYGSIYAIADISYSLAYAVGPIIAGGIVELIGFTALNFIIAITNLAYVPVLRYLSNVYEFKPFESEANILMGDPPSKEYQTYSLQNQQPAGDYKNHLEYGKIQEESGTQETNLDQQYDYSQQQYQQQDNYSYQQGGQQQYQPGYQEQGGLNQRSLPQPAAANPFRQQQEQQQQPPQAAPRPAAANPFRSGFN